MAGRGVVRHRGAGKAGDSLTVTGPRFRVAGAGSTVASSPSSTGVIALTVGLGALGLAPFGAGFAAFVCGGRRRDAPVTAKVSQK